MKHQQTNREANSDSRVGGDVRRWMPDFKFRLLAQATDSFLLEDIERPVEFIPDGSSYKIKMNGFVSKRKNS